MKPDLEVVSIFSYDFLCAFMCALKFLFSAFTDDLLFIGRGPFRDPGLDEVLRFRPRLGCSEGRGGAGTATCDDGRGLPRHTRSPKPGRKLKGTPSRLPPPPPPPGAALRAACVLPVRPLLFLLRLPPPCAPVMGTPDVLMLAAPPGASPLAQAQWRRGSSDADSVDALPYIDHDYADPQVKADVDKLIADEMRLSTKKPADFLAELPPVPSINPQVLCFPSLLSLHAPPRPSRLIGLYSRQLLFSWLCSVCPNFIFEPNPLAAPSSAL